MTYKLLLKCSLGNANTIFDKRAEMEIVLIKHGRAG